MSVEPKLMTADELFALPDDGMRHELVRGELRTMSPTGGEHGGLQIEIGHKFRVSAGERPIGRVVGGEVGFRLSRDPDVVRAADVAFIRFERLPDGRLPKTYIPSAPDLALEIVSPGDTAEEIETKVQDWLLGGARAVWVVYSLGPRVVVHRPDGTSRTHHADDELDGGDAFPGFRMKVADFLRAPGD